MILNITTLGSLMLIDEDGHTLSELDMKSVMMEKLLLYMIIYRKNPLSSEEICDAIWAEDESDNPIGALKNLTYRLRKLMGTKFKDQEFIITEQGGYRWNPEVIVHMDAEEFEVDVKKAKYTKDPKQAKKLYESAIRLYNGTFMPKLSAMSWIAPLQTYYHSLYTESVEELCELYVEHANYSHLDTLCAAALKIDPIEEKLYYYQIVARVNNDNLSLALETYENARKVLEKEFGVHQMRYLSKAHDLLVDASGAERTASMKQIQKEIIEGGEADGVFMCSYPIFREIFQLEARKATRTIDKPWLLLITIKGNRTDSSAVRTHNVRNGMKVLEEVIRNSLRIGDVCAKYSESQYIILLQAMTEELTIAVANRIIESVYSMDKDCKKLSIKFTQEEVVGKNSIK